MSKLNRENFAKLANHLETTQMGFTMEDILRSWDESDREGFIEYVRCGTITKAAAVALAEENGLIAPPCGSAGCLIGHIHVLRKKRKRLHASECAEWLGVSSEEKDALFFGSGIFRRGRDLSNITRSETIAHLRHVAAGGEVGWDQHLKPLNRLKADLLARARGAEAAP